MTTGFSKLTAALALLGGVALLTPGCYKPVRGNPVDQFHYLPSITVTQDHTHVIIQTYLNRNQWQVGLRREDLYDGDKDGKLESPGMDRVFITEYANVEDPPDKAQRSEGELPNYNQTFQDVLKAVGEGKRAFRIDKRDYELRVTTVDLGVPH